MRVAVCTECAITLFHSAIKKPYIIGGLSRWDLEWVMRVAHTLGSEWSAKSP